MENISKIEKNGNVFIVDLGENVVNKDIITKLLDFDFGNTNKIAKGMEAEVFSNGDNEVVRLSREYKVHDRNADLNNCIKHKNYILSHVNRSGSTKPKTVIIIKNENKFYIVETIKKRENSDFANKNEVSALPVVIRTIKSLATLHANGICHGDLHRGNIFLNKINKSTVGDFGDFNHKSNYGFSIEIKRLYLNIFLNLTSKQPIEQIIDKDILLNNEQNNKYVNDINKKFSDLAKCKTIYDFEKNFNYTLYLITNLVKKDKSKVNINDFKLLNEEQNLIISNQNANPEIKLKLTNYKNRLLYSLGFFTNDTLKAKEDSIKKSLEKTLAKNFVDEDLNEDKKILYNSNDKNKQVDLKIIIANIFKQRPLTNKVKNCFQSMLEWIDSDKPLDQDFFSNFHNINKDTEDFIVVADMLIKIRELKLARKIQKIEEQKQKLEDKIKLEELENETKKLQSLFSDTKYVTIINGNDKEPNKIEKLNLFFNTKQLTEAQYDLIKQFNKIEMDELVKL